MNNINQKLNNRTTTTILVRGFSTLELLIAFSIMTLSMTAVIMVAFGNQSLVIDTELAQRGLYIAQKRLEESGASLKNNFSSVANEFTALAFNDTYDTQVTVADISPCAKRVDSQAFWNRDLRNLKNKLSSIIVSPEESEALRHDCATEEATDNWDNPDILVSETINDYGATALDELDHTIYLTSNPGSENDVPEFYVYDFDDSDHLLNFIGELDLGFDDNIQNQYFGLYDVDVIDNYAFVASASTTAQLQVIDISDPSQPTLKWSIGLPGVSKTGSYPAARTLYYYNGRIYVGTKETLGPEFHIFDVSNDLSTTPPIFLGSLELTHNVNEIVVAGDYAYLATSDNNHELMVIDISNPASMIHPDINGLGYNAAGNNDGTSVYLSGDIVYLGRNQKSGTADDFFILNKPDILNDTFITDGLWSSLDIDLRTNGSITGIRVSGQFAFLSANDSTKGLIIYNISNPSNISLPTICSLFSNSKNNSSIDNDKHNKYLFTSNTTDAEIRIIYDKTSSCQS